MLYLYWGSYAIMALMLLGIMPYLIAAGREGEGNALTAFMGAGTWAIMLLTNKVLYPILSLFGDADNGIVTTSMQGGGVILKIIAFIIIGTVFLSLYILPFIVATKPSMVQGVADRVIG